MSADRSQGIVPVVRWFSDRPKRDATRLCVYWPDVHLFVFYWGMTVRWRRPQNFWRHATVYWRARPSERGRGGMLSVGTWLTTDGVTKRIAQSKRYAALKVLG